jgi:hypothetical protein
MPLNVLRNKACHGRRARELSAARETGRFDQDPRLPPTMSGKPDEAFEDQRWMFHGMTAGEEERVKLYLDQNLIWRDGHWRLPYE